MTWLAGRGLPERDAGMTRYEVGDFILIRAKVIEVHGPEHGYTVELFSKTDQYRAIVRPDLVVSKTEQPLPPEPDSDALVRDREGDIWRCADGMWRLVGGAGGILWADVASQFGPLAIYERAS